mgnify:CR=1 FL=1
MIVAAAAWAEWVRAERILRRQTAEAQTQAAERHVKLSALKKRLDEVTEKTAESLYLDVRALKRECLLGDAQLTRALYKALQASGLRVENYGTVFATIADADKEEALPLIRRFSPPGPGLE